MMQVLSLMLLGMMVGWTQTSQAQVYQPTAAELYGHAPGFYPANGAEYFANQPCAYGDEMHAQVKKDKDNEIVEMLKGKLKTQKQQLKEANTRLINAEIKLNDKKRAFSNQLNNISIERFHSAANKCAGIELTDKSFDATGNATAELQGKIGETFKGAEGSQCRSAQEETRKSKRETFAYDDFCMAKSPKVAKNTVDDCTTAAASFKTAWDENETAKKDLEDLQTAITDTNSQIARAKRLPKDDDDDEDADDAGTCPAGSRCHGKKQAKSGYSKTPLIVGGVMGALAMGLQTYSNVQANNAAERLGYPSGPNPYMSSFFAGYPYFMYGLYGSMYGGMGRGSYGCSPMAGANPWSNGYGPFAGAPGSGPFNGWNFPYGGNMYNPGAWPGANPMFNPMGVNPMMNPMGNMMNPLAMLNPMMNSMMNPMMNPMLSMMNPMANMMNPMGNMMNPMGNMMNPMGNMMNPMMNPMLNGGLNFGLNGGLNFPFAGGNGLGGYQYQMQLLQYQMQAMQDMQRKMVLYQDIYTQISQLQQQLMQLQYGGSINGQFQLGVNGGINLGGSINIGGGRTPTPVQ